jgi:hypothetical protein
MTVTYDATHQARCRCNPSRDSCVTYVMNSDTFGRAHKSVGELL